LTANADSANGLRL